MIVVAACLLVCMPVFSQTAAPQSGGCGPVLEKALELSGFNDAAKAMPEQVRQQIDQQMRNNEGMPEKDRTTLASLAMTAFATPKIIGSVRESFNRSCDVPMLQSTVKELQSETAQKIRQQEAMSMSPAKQQELRVFYERLATNPPEASRVALLERMDKSLAITDSTLDMILAISKGMVVGFGGKWGQPAEVEAMKLEYRPSIHKAMIANQLFTYRNVSDEDMGKYVAIYETPAVHKFSDQLQKSMLQAMAERSEVMGREFHNYLDKKPGQGVKKAAPANTAPKTTAPKKADTAKTASPKQ